MIFLDLDGVIVDFATASLRLHNRLDVLHDWPPGEWSISKLIGLSESDFWQPIDFAGEHFWSDLGSYHWKQELYDACGDKFTICTSPSYAASSCAGKKVWLNREFGRGFRNYVLTSQKHLMAKPGHLLIDDNDNNVKNFREHGGRAILFPQPWNSNHHMVPQRMHYVKLKINHYMEGSLCT